MFAEAPTQTPFLCTVLTNHKTRHYYYMTMLKKTTTLIILQTRMMRFRVPNASLQTPINPIQNHISRIRIFSTFSRPILKI